MWRNKEKRITGFLDQGADLTGELQFSGVLQIDGNFHGSITGGDTLIVGDHAVIHADIQVREIEIRGQVCGNVEAEGRVEIHSRGRLAGDLKTSAIIIHAGGTLDGNVRMASDAIEEPASMRESTRIVLKESKRRPRPVNDPDR
ncbi:MAG TPA: polymer-forming cytoskeletal protein [Terriglobia bacterium]|nr:polymer-forming cytoskeletal protein [Terriglobia bacterium]